MANFCNWTDKEPQSIVHEIIEGIADYKPGSFYKRELPCIMSLLDKLENSYIEAIIIDGYVILKSMHCEFRMPHLLMILDTETKNKVS